MYNVYLFPSFYSHVINVILLFFALFLLCKNYTTISKLEPYKLIMLVLVFSITIGIHGLSHLGLEKNYNYNPLEL